MNECYKCQAPIDAPQESVHPLCDSCEEEFQAWLGTTGFTLEGKEEDAI